MSAEAPSPLEASVPIAPWYHEKMSNGQTPFQMGLNFGLVGTSCVAAQGTVHWTRTAMVQQQLAGMRGEVPLGMVAQTASIWQSEGLRGLYRGFSAAALREATYSSLRFGLYEPLKVALDTSEGKEELPVRRYRRPRRWRGGRGHRVAYGFADDPDGGFETVPAAVHVPSRQRSRREGWDFGVVQRFGDHRGTRGGVRCDEDGDVRRGEN